MKITDIKVSDRHRKDLGDLTPLMQSIEEVGLLHPIVVTLDGTLVAGQRRLEALRRLGRHEADVTLVTHLKDATALLKAERDENTCRLDMTPSEKVALGRELEKLERPAAEERQRQLGRSHGTPSENFPEGSRKGETREIVGQAVGMSGVTYQRAKGVVSAAEDDSYPERVREVARGALKEMDETGKVQPAFNKVQKAKQTPAAPQATNGSSRKGRGYKNKLDPVKACSALVATVDALVAGLNIDALDGKTKGFCEKQLTHSIRELGTLRKSLKNGGVNV